ncbi:type I-F CRISPR-associated endoribonuclease Cas6/Csy4 [Aliidiomarina maris]|uniref:CRISPR-associated Csy4 family protein n=1 Tax=Aliidiomarina maris TaxID=531312 RepID=A0A327X303_9GAMM|nr:type I-F CRISPR-associated endoribonuclease Cas6/Csy4 [Aliidiomarina maris]RAK00602.1 CRISPR-associated Csy4 family protein [Aliidiomarina maris]RUO27386.1 type I-F CRISPR-associated endoribonuclease Cas6/Csy4 [Aliidiomarina maris]
MHHYLDITLLPDDGIGDYFLWGKLYQQLHLALVEHNQSKNGNIGISFPEYSIKPPQLGVKLRIFAPTESELALLNIGKWLNRFADYCHISSIKAVPEHTKFALFSRKQCQTNPERLARRRAKRKGETLEQAMQHFAGFKDESSKLPFIAMESLSSANANGDANKFRLIIEQKILPEHQPGNFNCYGLSQDATVPWF